MVAERLKKAGAAIREKFHSPFGEPDFDEELPSNYGRDPSCYRKPSTDTYRAGDPYVAPEFQRPSRVGSVWVS